MGVTLEGSNSAEAFPPPSGDIGSHLLSLRGGWRGLVVNFFFGFHHFFWRGGFLGGTFFDRFGETLETSITDRPDEVNYVVYHT